MKILIDMNISPVWVSVLNTAGIEAEHWVNIGAPSAPDTEIFQYAAAKGYIILTHDLDFSVILAKTQSRFPSVILLRCNDLLTDKNYPHVIESINKNTSALHDGAIVTIDLINFRVRTLPIS